MLTMDEIGAELTRVGVNRDVHLPKVRPTLMGYVLTGDAVAAVRLVEPPDASDDDPSDDHKVDGKPVTAPTVVFTLASGTDVPYTLGRKVKGAALT